VLDHAPLLAAAVDDRRRGVAAEAIAWSAHAALAEALAAGAVELRESHGADAVVLSGGVFQNGLLSGMVAAALAGRAPVLVNHDVPPNDGGICLGQAALAAFAEEPC
jgi:hydrogenase maturation protein HypF